MPYTAARVVSATIVVLLLGACAGSSRSSPSAPTFASAASANPVQRENSRPGTRGWEIPAGAGTVITGYGSETSVVPGQNFHLHVAAPAGSRYRVLLYRLGWYRGLGGRLITCVPDAARAARRSHSPGPPHPIPSRACSALPGG